MDTSTFQKTFTICQYHLDFLKTIDDNDSYALRKLLDKSMVDVDKEKKKQARDIGVMMIGFGCMMYILGVSDINLAGRLISFCAGSFFIVYGVMEGFWNVLQLRKKQ